MSEGTLDYKIFSLDWHENDGLISIGPQTFYFQWPAIEEPTLEEVLTYLYDQQRK